MSLRNARGLRNERGAAAVEFALVAMVFIVMIFGMLSYGFVFSLQHNMDHAAVEGARAALKATTGNEVAVAEQRARDSLSFSQAHNYATVTATLVTGTGCDASNTQVQCIHVAISFSYKDHPLVPPLFSIGVPETMTADYTVEL